MQKSVAAIVACLLLLANITVSSFVSFQKLLGNIVTSSSIYDQISLSSHTFPEKQSSQLDNCSEQQLDFNGDYSGNEFTNIHFAVLRGMKALSAALSEPDASSIIDKPNGQGQTPLHMATWKNNVEIICALLAHGADMTIKDADQHTPLQIAEMHGYREAIEVLKGNHDWIFTQDTRKNTLLHLAVQKGQYALVVFHLNINADALARNYIGQSPLHIAARHGFADIISLLLSNIESKHEQHGSSLPDSKSIIVGNFSDKFGRTPLYIAAKHGQISAINALVHVGNLVDAKNNQGWSPLHIAAFSGKADVVRLLLVNKADATAKEKYGRTPLHLAALSGHVDAAWALLESNSALIHIEDNAKWTPLHVAAHFGKLEVVLLLLENGADVNVKSKDEESPLHCAAHRDYDFTAKVPLKNRVDSNDVSVRHLAVIKALLEWGADAKATDANGDTPFDVAIFNRDIDAINQLSKYMFKNSARGKSVKVLPPLHVAVLENRIVEVKRLLKCKAEANEKFLSEFSPLYLAVKLDYIDIAEVLLENKADVHERLAHERTLLHISIMNSNVEAVKLLLKHGAEVDAADDNGNTSAHYAAMYNDLSIIMYLGYNDANFNAKNHAGLTPTQLARELKSLHSLESRMRKGRTPTGKRVILVDVSKIAKLQREKLDE